MDEPFLLDRPTLEALRRATKTFEYITLSRDQLGALLNYVDDLISQWDQGGRRP